ncbi:hypothetical protein KVF89_04190 [Nocardioides carbamazepini]|uniref:hypothetical protein n=1 Tax=Nocardioides carbamazepini TaxID=2854259 RepID=UPI00214A8448|nr:hypothetical protein [Nocardioides carbamazepini]MCR1781726.1 hypothetical protein [Nocardioides carbamazepini]
MTRPDGGGGGISFDYSDQRFETVTDEIEDLLADLMGIEAAAEMFRTHLVSLKLHHEGEQVAPTVRPISLPASKPFTVYPILPEPPFDTSGDQQSYQDWINEAYAAGAQSAAGTGAWLRSIMDNFHLVDAEALINGADQQAGLVIQHGTTLTANLGEVNAALADEWDWDGDSMDAFFTWVAVADAAPAAMLLFAYAAQSSVAKAGAAIGATQEAMMQQAENARDALKATIKAWRDDADAFPFPPGSGWTFKDIGTEIGGVIESKVQALSDTLPDLGPLGNLGKDWALDKVTGTLISKIPAVKPATLTYKILTTLEANEVEVEKQPTAQVIIDTVEQTFRDIAKEGDAAVTTAGEGMAALAASLHDADQLVMPRPDPTPAGHYERD